MRRQVLEILSQKGTLVEPDAADLLCSQPNPLKIIEGFLSVSKRGLPMVLTRKDMEELLRLGSTAQEIPNINVITKDAVDREMTHAVTIKKEITGMSTCIGDIADFMRLFEDRYRSIKRMLLRRRELQGSVSIAKAKKLEREIRIIGMVSSTRTTKNGHRIISIEDEDDSITVLALKGSPAFNDVVVNDEVIGVIGNTAKRGEMIVAKEIVRPDIPINGGLRRSDSKSWALFVGDIHIGSNTFLENQWRSFLEWLKTAEEAADVKYLIMPGDLVDGIGIYPDQEDELLIDDVYRQYEILAEQLKDVRDDILILASPGNHDAVRLAEPQPALPKSISCNFDSNIRMVGNPAMVEVEGRKILIYHGRSIDDWIGSAPGFSYQRPLDIMKEMLRRRHLAPIYGERTAIAPEQKDYLVIDEVPDIFVTGHVHTAGLGDYRGVIMINSSTWQDQTLYQKMHNHTPDPCKAFMIQLGSGKARMVKFT